MADRLCARDLRVLDRKSIRLNCKRLKRWLHFKKPRWKWGPIITAANIKAE